MHFKRNKAKGSGAVGAGVSAYSKKKRSVEIDTEKMYDHYMEESKGITVKAEGERDRLSRLLDMTKQIRTYDLKRIRNQELEELNLNLTGLKTDWSGIKSSL
jgi:tRNA(Phe) wybutosine-synthesizing methylase Tyw3